MLKRSPKVHLSPQLARTIGRTSETEKTYLIKVIAVVALSIFLFAVISGINKESMGGGLPYPSQANAGEVLGAQTANVINYTVNPGDTLIGVSKKFNVFWMTLVEENELTVPYSLTPGQILRIPLPRN